MDYITTQEAARVLNISARDFLGLIAFGAISVHEVVSSDGAITKYVSRQEIETRNPYAIEILLKSIRLHLAARH